MAHASSSTEAVKFYKEAARYALEGVNEMARTGASSAESEATYKMHHIRQSIKNVDDQGTRDQLYKSADRLEKVLVGKVALTYLVEGKGSKAAALYRSIGDEKTAEKIESAKSPDFSYSRAIEPQIAAKEMAAFNAYASTVLGDIKRWRKDPAMLEWAVAGDYLADHKTPDDVKQSIAGKDSKLKRIGYKASARASLARGEIVSAKTTLEDLGNQRGLAGLRKKLEKR